jgi:hypothetical protein
VSIAALGADLHVLNMRTRMPFRYGIASMTALPHLFVRLQTVVDGKEQAGLASDGLPPKWFTKDPSTTFRSDLKEMLDVIRHACDLVCAAGPAPTVFELWRRVYDDQAAWGAARGYPPLLTGLGTSLVERALIDAFTRATGTTFAASVRSGALGIDLGALHPELADRTPADLLPERPLSTAIARHTIGLADPLEAADVAANERLEDGLPQSLAACIDAYGLTHFKVKVLGSLEDDLDRVRRIAAVVERHAAPEYAFTLDGNEQFHDADAFREYWRRLSTESSLGGFMRHLLFVEQPLHRDVALDDATGETLLRWRDRPPTIIDEADGTIDSLPRALAIGYAGTSHKNCKGVFKGVANACLVAARRRADPRSTYGISSEDLANVGPVALLQDLAVAATLGIEHVERNGHHYFAGLSALPPEVQAQVLRHHADLYRRHPDGYPTLDVVDGRVSLQSVVDAPFGTAFLVDPTQFTPLPEWRFESLGVSE